MKLLIGCCAAVLFYGLLAVPQANDGDAIQLRAIDQRLERVEAIKAIERLQSSYGYYQDRFLFNEPPTLFADNGAEAHYEGGVWLGQTGIQRLWLGVFSKRYSDGTNGPVAGRMFDEPQLQGVIDVSDDGLTAKARFRTLGRLAIYHQKEEWVAGVYENEYVKEGGKWKFKVFRYCSPWSAPYNQGWIEAKANYPSAQWKLYPEDPDGPDRIENPAEACNDRFPQPGLLPFHFVHPVTGKPVQWTNEVSK
jgi:SnoaL-like domain